jgi:16S rRNA (uracil1498-N3)-methyltransferase
VSKTVKFERLNRLVIAAMKQSGRLYVPTLELKTKFEKPKQLCFYGSLNQEDTYLTSAKEDTAFIIGPEKGFHPTELEQFKEWNIFGKRLNHNILRAETASIAAAAILLTRASEQSID